MSDHPVLPRLQIPDSALLLYENVVIDDPDRTGNWRFRIDDDGCFYNARNTQLWLTEAEQFLSDDPGLTWNTSFAETPDRCLTETQMAELAEAIRVADFPTLKAVYASSASARVSSPRVERWTLVQDDSPITVVVEEGAAPARLIDLRATIDRLVADAPRPDSPQP